MPRRGASPETLSLVVLVVAVIASHAYLYTLNLNVPPLLLHGVPTALAFVSFMFAYAVVVILGGDRRQRLLCSLAAGSVAMCGFAMYAGHLACM